MSKPKLDTKTNLNNQESLSNKKSHQSRKWTATPTIVPKHKYNTRNRIYSDPLNLDNYVAIFDMCTHTDSSPTVSMYPFFAQAVIDPNIGASLEYRHLVVIPKK